MGSNNADGTGVGITSIGNSRDPYLPFVGADIIAGAGIGISNGLDSSQLNFTDKTSTGFIDLFLDPATGGAYATRYLPDLGTLLGLTNATDSQIWTAYSQLPVEQQDTLAPRYFLPRSARHGPRP